MICRLAVTIAACRSRATTVGVPVLLSWKGTLVLARTRDKKTAEAIVLHVGSIIQQKRHAGSKHRQQPPADRPLHMCALWMLGPRRLLCYCSDGYIYYLAL